MTDEDDVIYFSCPVEATIDLIGGKWKPIILWHLKEGTQRFSQLQKALPDISPKMLTKQLKELENAKLVRRTFFPEIPPRVEYALTPLGESIIPVLKSMADWGVVHLKDRLKLECSEGHGP